MNGCCVGVITVLVCMCVSLDHVALVVCVCVCVRQSFTLLFVCAWVLGVIEISATHIYCMSVLMEIISFRICWWSSELRSRWQEPRGKLQNTQLRCPNEPPPWARAHTPTDTHPHTMVTLTLPIYVSFFSIIAILDSALLSLSHSLMSLLSSFVSLLPPLISSSFLPPRLVMSLYLPLSS